MHAQTTFLRASSSCRARSAICALIWAVLWVRAMVMGSPGPSNRRTSNATWLDLAPSNWWL
ncbi:hypothetical protein PF003_g29971 [Phytophthora fragariae]|nr:hypothetical protein PF003_g29971 [Phytophthora fragariae]